MTARGRKTRYKPRGLLMPMAGTLMAIGLTGCPGRVPEDASMSDVRDIQMADASDVSDVQTDTLIDTPADTPTDTPIDTPMDVPMDVPVDTPTDTPTDVPGDVPVMDPAPSMIRRVALCGTTCRRPTDAVLNAAGTTIYFTAFDAMGNGAVFSVPNTMGATITMLASGGDLNYPQSIAISDDDSTLYIADLAADRSPGDGLGALFSLSTSGGTPARLSTGAGATNPVFSPSGIAVDGDNLIVTGARRTTMGTAFVFTPALFRVPRAGGSATLIVADSMLADPSDVAVGPGGIIQVFGGGNGVGTGGFATVMGTTATPHALNFVANWPAGIAASRDGNNVLVAGWAPGAARLNWVRSDGTMPMSPATISTGLVAPTGIGRARNAPIYVVADESAGTGGTAGSGGIFEVR